MDVVQTVEALSAKVRAWRQEGLRVAFVPTMGNLHQGHLSLVERARMCADRVVTSIYVNPTQFNRSDDLDAYPRTLARDTELLRSADCDVLFNPTDAVVYPKGKLVTHITVPGISDVLEGEHRPGHFTGVATVVCKLFNMVQPDVAVFGEKDFQQLMLVRQMVEDLDIQIQIEGAATARETDGLAMSSRNNYLTTDERIVAPNLYHVLTSMLQELKQGERDYLYLQHAAMKTLDDVGFQSEYMEIRRRSDLAKPEAEDKELVILASAWLGKARLIDNMTIDL